jgi:hypothetical protein
MAVPSSPSQPHPGTAAASLPSSPGPTPFADQKISACPLLRAQVWKGWNQAHQLPVPPCSSPHSSLPPAFVQPACHTSLSKHPVQVVTLPSCSFQSTGLPDQRSKAKVVPAPAFMVSVCHLWPLPAAPSCRTESRETDTPWLPQAPLQGSTAEHPSEGRDSGHRLPYLPTDLLVTYLFTHP